MKVGEKYQGRKWHCMSWKKKGKCSKGEYCNFIHDQAMKGNGSGSSSSSSSSSGGGGGDDVDDVDAEGGSSSSGGGGGGSGNSKPKGICNTFKKKGKCRKGDKCPYSHDLPNHNNNNNNNNNSSSSSSGQWGVDEWTKEGGKKRKITGAVLVDARRARLNTVTKFED